jgi:hypothetical protein
MQTKDGQHVAARLVSDRCASQREIWKVRTCFLILAFTWVAIFAFFSNLTIPPLTLSDRFVFSLSTGGWVAQHHSWVYGDIDRLIPLRVTTYRRDVPKSNGSSKEEEEEPVLRRV